MWLRPTACSQYVAGGLTAYDIALEAELYDPARYYGEVKDLWYGWGAAIEDREDPAWLLSTIQAVRRTKDRRTGPLTPKHCRRSREP